MRFSIDIFAEVCYIFKSYKKNERSRYKLKQHKEAISYGM